MFLLLLRSAKGKKISGKRRGFDAKNKIIMKLMSTTAQWMFRSKPKARKPEAYPD